MAEDERTGDRPRVLVVDDDSAARHLLSVALDERDGNVETVTAADGEEALEFLRRCDGGDAALPDVVVLDLDLPGRNGHEVLREIRETPGTRSLPVVILSQNDSQSVVDTSFHLGANAYLVKPETYEGLLDATRVISYFWEADVDHRPAPDASRRSSRSDPD